jgi:hypothetical protein
MGSSAQVRGVQLNVAGAVLACPLLDGIHEVRADAVGPPLRVNSEIFDPTPLTEPDRHDVQVGGADTYDLPVSFGDQHCAAVASACIL